MIQEFVPLPDKNNIINISELAGFSLTEAIYSPGERASEHTHNEAHISFVLRGSYTERHRNRSWECKTSTLIFHPAGLTHSIDFDDTQTQLLTIEIKPRWLDYICEKTAILNRPAHIYDGLPVSLAARLLGEFRRGDSFSSLAIEGLALEIIAAATRLKEIKTERKNARWLNQVEELLRAGFADNLTIETIAKTVNVHPTHLARVFRRQTGCTIGEYIRRLRLECASHQLVRTNKPLREIAVNAGFADQSHFSRTFKSYFGSTPREYRKKTHLR
jgi:AraC family transcriptional regulator